jgi:signal transduction histidine kinase
VDLRDRIVEKDTLSHMTNVLAKVGGWYYDIATERYFWSDEVRKIHEVDDDFIPTNDSVSALFTSKDMQAITDATASVVETGTPQVLETATTTSKGNERWLRIFISASFDRGTAVRIYGATQDISEIREREEEMEKLVKELTIQRDLLEEFGSLISHQLRGPLTNLATIADLLVETTDDEERWRLMQALRESVKGMDRTLEEVSDAVHVRRRVHTKSERIDVARLIDSVTKELAPSILEIGASIDVDTSQLPEIVYPVVYFESIVRQLVTNALRFAHADRPLRVHLCTMTHSGDPLLTVRDNGMGMDLGKHGSRLFRLGSTFHKHSSGRGVGLFMVRSIVESLGGEILVESEAGVGTAFTVNLRTHDAEAT